MFAENLRFLRKREKLTQQEMADKLGVSRSTIAMYENGSREPDFETLEAIRATQARYKASSASRI